MSKEFPLDGDKDKVTGRIHSDLNQEDIQLLNNILDYFGGVDFNLDEKNKLIKAEIKDSSKDPEEVVNELLSRLEDTRIQGDDAFFVEDISFEIEQVEDDSERTKERTVDVEQYDNFWELFEEYSEGLTDELRSYALSTDEDALKLFNEFMDAESSAAGYVMANLDFSRQEIQFLLGNEEFTGSEFERQKSDYEDEIELAEEGSEYRDIWVEILETHKQNKEKRDSMIEEIDSLTEEYIKISENGSDLRKGFEHLESEEDLNVGWIEKNNRNMLLVPMGSNAEGSEEVLYKQIRREVQRHAHSIYQADNYTMMELDVDAEEVYNNLRVASEKLGIDLDYSFNSSKS